MNAPHPNPITRRFLEVGLPATLPADQRAAWESYQQGKGAPIRLLPTNGDRCTAMTWGGAEAGCGYPLLIDGECPNRSEHAVADPPTPDASGRFAVTFERAAEMRTVDLIAWLDVLAGDPKAFDADSVGALARAAATTLRDEFL
jgi:hypothetical protein